ncbi:MAG: hypothetical protein WBL25_09940 [Anaerolineales bacterium]
MLVGLLFFLIGFARSAQYFYGGGCPFLDRTASLYASFFWRFPAVDGSVVLNRAFAQAAIGVGMVSGFVSLPMMIPFFVIPFALIEEIENIRTIIIAASLCLVVYMPVLAVVQSGALTFLKTGRMLTYLRLTRSPGADIPVSHLA